MTCLGFEHQISHHGEDSCKTQRCADCKISNTNSETTAETNETLNFTCTQQRSNFNFHMH